MDEDIHILERALCTCEIDNKKNAISMASFFVIAVRLKDLDLRLVICVAIGRSALFD